MLFVFIEGFHFEGKGIWKGSQTLDPILITDHRDTVDVSDVGETEFGVGDQSTKFHAFEVVQIDEKGDPRVARGEGLEFGEELTVLLGRDLSVDGDPDELLFREPGVANRMARWFGRAFEPVDGVGRFTGIEAPELRFDEMTGEFWKCLEKTTVGNHRDAWKFAMVVADEPKVGPQACEVGPTREVRSVDEQSLEFAASFKPRINFLLKSRKIFCGQRAGRLNHKDAGISEAERDHSLQA